MERDVDLWRRQDLEVFLKEMRASVEALTQRGQDVGDAPRLIAETEEALARGDLEEAEACARLAVDQISDATAMNGNS